MNTIGKIFASALAVIISAYLIPGVEVADFLTAIIVAVVLALVNFFVKPILVIITIVTHNLRLGFIIWFIHLRNDKHLITAFLIMDLNLLGRALRQRLVRFLTQCGVFLDQSKTSKFSSDVG